MGIYPAVYITALTLAVVTVALLGFLVVRQSIVLRKLARNEKRQRELLGLAMEYLEEPEFIPAFKAQLKKGDMRQIVQVFVDLLPKLKGDYVDNVVSLMRELGIQKTSIKALRSKKWWRRADAAAILGYFKDPTVISALEDALDDSEVHVRLEAARSLSRQKAISSVAGLVARLSVVDPSHSLAVREIFRSLGKTAAPGLIAVLESDVPESTKIVSADALGHIGDPRAVRALLKVFDAGEHAGTPSQVSRHRGFSASPQMAHRNISLQLTVMRALSQLYDDESIKALTTALDDPLWEIRACACECLGQMGERGSISKLEHLLGDNHWWVRYYAANALFNMGASGMSALQRAVAGLSSRAREIAGDLLREKGVPMTEAVG
jgi:HEAT repeat protein